MHSFSPPDTESFSEDDTRPLLHAEYPCPLIAKKPPVSLTHAVNDEQPITDVLLYKNAKRTINKSSILYIFLVIMSGLGLTLSVIFGILVSPVPRGNVWIGNSNNVLILSEKSTGSILSITISATPNNESEVDAYFYDGVCSEIRKSQRAYNVTRYLTVTENVKYGIDELYLTNGSQVTYKFKPTSQDSKHCIANISIYSDYIPYWKHANGHVKRSICLPPAELQSFSVNSSDEDKYYFIGLESFESTILNYTVFKDLLEYEVSGLSQSTCTFSITSPDCEILLNYPSDQEICVFAQSDDFIFLSYHEGLKTETASIVLGIFAGLCFLIVICISWCIICNCYFNCI